MKYDFTTLVNRADGYSSKWAGMKKNNPNVGKDIVPFSVADMELKNPPEIITGLKKFLDTAVLGYSKATDGYLQSVCNWMKKRHNWNIEKDWIVNTPGCVPAFFNAVRAFTQSGDGVIVMTPVYYPFYLAMQVSNRKLVENPLINKGGRYEIDFADLEAKAKDPSNKVLLFCSPHNPVGRVWDKEELEKIGKICLDNNVLIISDEIHFDLIMPGHTHTVFATLSKELSNNMITCTAPSKTFNLAGLQNSNIIIENKEIREKFAFSFLESAQMGVNTLGYVACETAYNECEEWLDQLLVHLDHNRQVVEDYCAKNIPQIKVTPLEGTYLQWLDCRALKLDPKEMEKIMQTEAELFFDEGYIFGESAAGFERINIACPTDVLVAALDRFAVVVKKYTK